MLVTFYRTSKFALNNFWRNLWLSVITIFILVLTVFTVSLVGTLNLLADQAIQAVEEKIDVDIFFKADTSMEDIIATQIFLESIDEVKNVRYVSEEEAEENFRTLHSDDAVTISALDELDDNPLPASLVVQAHNLDDYQIIIDQFEASQYDNLADDKKFTNHQLVINKLSTIVSRVYQGGIIVSLIFIIISIIMMFNTVRIAIYSHREELGVMKLVGATNWFIRAPFMFEGILYAIVASVLGMTLLWLVVLSSSPQINNFFEGYNFSLDYFFYSNFWYIFAVQLLFSLLLAVGSSMISIGRYLKV